MIHNLDMILLAIFGFTALNVVESQDMMEVTVPGGDTIQQTCDGDTVYAFDSVEFVGGDDECSFQAYRGVSASCLNKNACVLDTTAFSSCPDSDMVVKYRCVDSVQIIDICESHEQIFNSEVLYIRTPDYPTIEYQASQDCMVYLNMGSMSSVYVLDMNLQPRTSTGCYDWLQVFENGNEMVDQICGVDVNSIKGSDTVTQWENRMNMSVLFKADDTNSNMYRGFILRVDGPEQPEETTTTTTTTTTITTTTPSPTTTTRIETTTTDSTSSTSTTTTTTTNNPTTTTTSGNIETTTDSTTTTPTTTTTTSVTTTTITSEDVVPSDMCESNPCHTGEVCLSDLHTYVCSCPTRYIGWRCVSAAPNLATSSVILWLLLVISMMLFH